MNLRGFFSLQLHIKYFYHKDTSSMVLGIVLFNRCIWKKTIYPGKSKKETAEKKNKNKKAKSRIRKKRINRYIKKKYKDLLKIFKVEYIYAGSKIGAEDAALTAQVTGAAYILFGNILNLIDGFIKIRNVNIDVRPVYNKFYFNFRFQCILKIKKANAIKEIFKFFVWIIKEKLEALKKNERTSYIRSYDHSYAKH